MPYDTTIQAMLLSYDKTAQRLMDGEKIEGDELYRFLGVTGVLSVQMQRQLWSQEELKAQIKEEQERQCKNCPNSKAIEILMADLSHKPLPPPPPPSAPESPQNIWTMMAVSVAQNMKTLIICVVSAILIATLTAIVSGRVAEVASAVATTTSAIHDK